MGLYIAALGPNVIRHLQQGLLMTGLAGYIVGVYGNAALSLIILRVKMLNSRTFTNQHTNGQSSILFRINNVTDPASNKDRRLFFTYWNSRWRLIYKFCRPGLFEEHCFSELKFWAK
jgi:hypothetical protein